MEIPGWLYLLIGFIVTGVSYYVNSTQSTGKMLIFLAVGIVLMIVGIIKIIFGNFKQIDKDTKNPEDYYAKQAAQAINQVQTKNKQGFRQSRIPNVKYCSNCGQILRSSDNFCFRCGNRN